MMRTILLLCFLLCARLASAAQCNAVFANVLQGHGDNSRLTLSAQAKVNNAPSTVMPFVAGTFDSLAANRCGSADCSVSGFASPSLRLSNFPSFSGNSYNSYGGVIGQGRTYSQTFNSINAIAGTTSFSDNFSHYYVQSLYINSGAKVSVKPGIYWIRTLSLKASANLDDVALEVVGDGTAYLLVENLYINNNRVIDGINASGLLSINTYGNVNVKSAAKISGLLYAQGSVYLKDKSVFTGVLAAANVTLDRQATVNYQDVFSDHNLSALCDVSADKQLHLQYEFNQQQWLNSGDVVDTSGNNKHGTALGNANAQSYSAGTCKVLDIPANTSHAKVDAVDTRLDINEVGDKGSIAFWYRSDLPWANKTRKQLFDASNEITSPKKHFYLSLGSGSLQFSIEDDKDLGVFATVNNLTVEANQWVHITATWDMANKRIQIYLNTSQSARTWYLINNNLSDTLGDMSSLYLGDSRSRYFVERSTANSAHGQFESLHVFNYVLENNEARRVAQATPSCDQADATLVAHWPLNLCSLSGESGEVTDVIGGLHGRGVNGADTIEQGRLCQSGDFSGQGAHLNLPHGDSIEVNDGSVSLWFRVTDLDHRIDSSRDAQVVLSKDANGYGNGGHLTAFIKRSGSVNIRHQSTTTSFNLSSPSNLIQENQWHHLVYTFGAQSAQLYLDGQRVARSRYRGGIANNKEPIIIGSGAWKTTEGASPAADLVDHFRGQVDDVKIYHGQLSNQQIKGLYNEKASSCIQCNPQQQLAHYRFEQTQWDSPGAILDSSPMANHASALGAVSSVYPSEAVACKALNVPQSSAISNTFNAVDTGIDVDGLNGRGSISFYYRSHQDWDSGNPRQLFDASTSLGDANQSKYFYLAINAAGRLDFGMEDENDQNFSAATTSVLRFEANEWVHIALTWDVSEKIIDIYLDGIQQPLTRNIADGLSTKPGAFNTLYIGDNRTNYFVASSTRNSANGQFDDVRVYTYVQNGGQIDLDRKDKSTCSKVYKYLIEHDGNGLTCEPETISIKACANQSCSQLYDQPHTIQMLPSSGWTDGASVTIPASGQVDAQLSQTTAGSYTLAVAGATTTCNGTASGTCDIEFADAGLQFIGANIGDKFGDQLAEGSFSNAQLRAVKNDDSSGSSQCVAALNGQVDIEFSMSCDAPHSCLNAVSTVAGNITDQGYTPVSLIFDNNGIASLRGLSYADAGLISLKARSQLQGANLIVGSSQFVVYPDSLQLQTNLPADSAAGEDFNLQVAALGVNGHRLPNYSPGNIQVQLSRLSPLDDQSVNGILTYAQSSTISSTMAASFTNSQIRASNPNISVNTGVMAFSAYYNEYGQVALDIRDQDYFSHRIGTASGGQSAPLTLGTFSPAYYAAAENATTLSSTCAISSEFSYLGKDLAFRLDPELTLTAKNALGQTMQNFFSDENWHWLTTINVSDIAFVDEAFSGQIDYFAQPELIVSNNADQGSRTLTLSQGSVLYSKPESPSAPFSAKLKMHILPNFLTDTSFGRRICYQQTYNKGAADDCDTADSLSALDDINNVKTIDVGVAGQFRWGRLRIENGFGPENQDMLLSVLGEYYTGEGFIVNGDDSCTRLPFSANDFNLYDSSGQPTSLIAILDSDMTLASGRTLGFEGIRVRNVDNETMGEYRVELKPLADQGISWDDYLQYDFKGTESEMGHPSAIVSFGQFRGNDRIIHWREVSQ